MHDSACTASARRVEPSANRAGDHAGSPRLSVTPSQARKVDNAATRPLRVTVFAFGTLSQALSNREMSSRRSGIATMSTLPTRSPTGGGGPRSRR